MVVGQQTAVQRIAGSILHGTTLYVPNHQIVIRDLSVMCL